MTDEDGSYIRTGQMKRTIKISSSGLDYLELCLRKFNLGKIQRLYPRIDGLDKYRNAKLRGILIHKMLAEYYRIKKDRTPEGEDILGIVQSARAESLIEDTLPSETIEESIKVFMDYCMYYKGDTWKVLEVESAFSTIIYENEQLRVLFEGVIDLIVEDEHFGHMIVDHKSIQRENHPNQRTNQFLGYTYVTKTNTLLENRLGMQKTKSVPERFTRPLHSYSDDNWIEWINSVEYHVNRLDEHIQKGYYPSSFSHCHNCVYKELCNIGSEKDRQFSIDTRWLKGAAADLFIGESEG